VKTVPSWSRAISVPTALLGVAVFFLPWGQFSCRQLSLNVSISGYEFATGTWQQKFDSKRIDEFWTRVDSNRPNRRIARSNPTTIQRAVHPLTSRTSASC